MSDDNNTTAPHAKPLDCDVNTLSVEEAIAFAHGTEDGNEIDANTAIIAEAEAAANEALGPARPTPMMILFLPDRWCHQLDVGADCSVAYDKMR